MTNPIYPKLKLYNLKKITHLLFGMILNNDYFRSQKIKNHLFNILTNIKIGMNQNNLLIVITILIVLLSNTSRAQEKGSAVEFEAVLTSDFALNFYGGLSQKAVYLGNLDLTMTLDTEKMKLWKNGTFFVYALNNHGKSLSSLVGDFQGVSNIEANSNTRLYQFWYQHKIGNVSLIIGQHDLNSEFAVSEYGGMFINSSFGIQPDISANVPTSIFPVATFGGIIKWNISPKFSFHNAVYDGDPGSQEDSPKFINFKFSKKEGVMTIHELHFKHIKEDIIKGTYKLGFWNHTANIVSNNVEYGNTQGIYFIADQSIFSEQNNNEQGLNAFIQLGIAPRKLNTVRSYIGAGLVYKGLIPQRDNDNLGLAFGHIFYSDTYRNDHLSDALENETVIEFSYEMPLNSHFSIQPDLQYVFNPEGVVSNKNAFIALIRLKIGF